MKKNIGIFIHTLGRGGAEQACLELVNRLSLTKYNVNLYTLIDTGNLRQNVDEKVNYIPLLKIPGFLKKKTVNETGTLIKGDSDKQSIFANMYEKMWVFFPRLINILYERKTRNNDIYISYLEGPTSIFVSNIKTTKPKVAWTHVDLSVEKKSERFFRNKTSIANHYKKFDELIAVSEDVKSSIENYISKDLNAVVIHNVYDTEKIISKSEEKLSMETESFFEEDKINLISVGRLAKQKGYDRLINALIEMRTDFPELYIKLNIIIVGDGEEYSRLIALSEKNNISVIKFIGFNQNPYSLIKKSDYFLCSSRTEGFSTVVVESLIIGTRILTTDCSGMKEILDRGILGKIEENSQDGILRLLLHAARNEEGNEIDTLKLMVSEKFDTANQVTIHQDFFDELMEKQYENNKK